MEQTNLNIGTIGQKLEAARRSKGVSVSEAGQATKILSKFIDAMESDDFGALSAPVYAKSFIRMYAQYLGLEAQPLVDEYTAQHAPRKKNNLGDEVRQKLAQVDHIAGDSNGAVSSSSGVRGKIFGGVNEAMSRLSDSAPSLKLIVSVAGGILLLLIILFSLTQCAGEEEKEPAAVGGAASVQHDMMTDAVPDVYLGNPGEIEID